MAAELGKATIGAVAEDVIARQVAHTVVLRSMRAEDLMTLTDEEWDRLVGAAFGAGFGSLRLAVLRSLLRDYGREGGRYFFTDLPAEAVQ